MNKSILARNIVFFEELKRILERFAEKGIRVILLKGASLLQRIYPDFSSRPMEDIDLLVHKNTIPQIKEILSSLSYRQIPAGDWEFVKVLSGDFPPVMLDLQEEIWYIPDSERIWNEAIDYEIAGEKVLLLPPEEEIIYLAVDGIVHHGKIDPIRTEDIRRLIDFQGNRINWSEIVKKIKKYGLNVPLSLIFSAVENVPEWVKKKIRPGSSFTEGLYKIILSYPEQDDIGHFLRPLCHSTIWGGFSFLLTFFFPGKEFLVRRYELKNNVLVFLYIFLRPLMLILKGMKLTINLLLGYLRNRRDASPDVHRGQHGVCVINYPLVKRQKSIL